MWNRLKGDMQFNNLPTDNDVAVIFYITGYCFKSLTSQNKYAQCKGVAVAGITDSIDNILDNANNFFKDIL